MFLPVVFIRPLKTSPVLGEVPDRAMGSNKLTMNPSGLRPAPLRAGELFLVISEFHAYIGSSLRFIEDISSLLNSK